LRKIRVCLLFGGKSAEHEVSLQSAKSIFEAIDKNKYDIVLIGIDKQGQWYLNEASHFLLHAENPRLIALNKSSEQVALVPAHNKNELVNLSNHQTLGPIDVVFPILHGPYGEDGTIQGLLKLFNAPFVGASVLGSAIGMDKDVMKRLLRDADLPIPNFLTFSSHELKNISFDLIKERLGIPCFVKPANMGSSVGIHKVKDKSEFFPAITDAFQYDHKILIEEYIKGREIEISVLGNENPITSIPGEIIPQHDFYSYNAKYIDEKGAILKIPAELPNETRKTLQEIAIKAYQVLCCEGMARVDFFLRNDSEIFISEINTIPGFTKISMYPKLWEASGIPYAELIDRLIKLALERAGRENRLKISVEI
jgi:D-alanine-D-alanine ligase